MGCPYCRSGESCEHHLLSVDVGERHACGGAMRELFNARLKGLQRTLDLDDFDDPDGLFDERLAEVVELAGLSDTEIAGGLAPGAFAFYCSTATDVDKAVDLYAVRYGLSGIH